MADAPRSTNLVSKRSRDLKKAEPSAGNLAPLPKVKHRDKKAGFVLEEKQKAELKAQFDALCRPLEGKEERVDNWIQLNARKDKDLEAWLKKHTAAFENLVRFNPEQFHQVLEAQDFTQTDAARYTNALVVSQSAFSSTSNYNAAREVVKLVAKSVIWTPKQLLEKLRNISEAGVLPSSLEAAAGDVGSKSQAIRSLLTLAADLQGQGERSEESVAADIQALNLALAWLNKKRANTSRHSAPTGAITLDSLQKQAKTVSIKPSPGKEGKFSREASDAQTPPGTPRGEAQREEKTGEKPKHKSKSRSKVTEEAAPGSASASKREKSRSADVEREPSDKLKEERKTGGRMPSHPQPSAAITTTTTTTATTTNTTDTGVAPHPLSNAQTASSPAENVRFNLAISREGENPSNVSSPRRAHQRQTSGINQNPILIADLNQALQKKS